jgi:hypothetical protein
MQSDKTVNTAAKTSGWRKSAFICMEYGNKSNAGLKRAQAVHRNNDYFASPLDNGCNRDD